MNLPLRKRKIKYLQEQQRELKGIPIRREEINYWTSRVKRVANRKMKVKPKEIVKIVKDSNPIRKEKLKQLKEQTFNLKKLPSKKLNKRMFY